MPTECKMIARSIRQHGRTNPKGKKNPSQDKTLTGILILNLSLIFLIYKKMITSNHD